jgi:hypothetical protein
MQRRQHRTVSLAVSDSQKSVLDTCLNVLPEASNDGPAEGGSSLPGLFYHPNGACRVMALVLSSAFDAVNEKRENAARKLARAQEVFQLVSVDETGQALLEDLHKSLTEHDSLDEFLGLVHGNVATYLNKKMRTRTATPTSATTPHPQPRAIEEGEDLPVERLVSSAAPDDTAETERDSEPENADESEQNSVQHDENNGADDEITESDNDVELSDNEFTESETEVELSDEDITESDNKEEVIELETTDPAANLAGDDDTEAENSAETPPVTDLVETGEGSQEPETTSLEVGTPSESESDSAAKAALEAMEAPYDTSSEGTSRRFDPELDEVEEVALPRRRGRRQRSTVGLERSEKADSGLRLPTKGEVDAALAAAEDVTGERIRPEETGPILFADRHCKAETLAEAILEAAQNLLHKSHSVDLSGSYKVEISVSPSTSTEGTGRRRRRRSRNRPRSRPSEE